MLPREHDLKRFLQTLVKLARKKARGLISVSMSSFALGFALSCTLHLYFLQLYLYL